MNEIDHDQTKLRVQALVLAVDVKRQEPALDVLKTAREYFRFLTGEHEDKVDPIALAQSRAVGARR